MKKIYTVLALFVVALLMQTSAVFAAATLPSNAVWYEPVDTAVGAPITLHALVYNNTSADATVTVDFTTVDGKVATSTMLVTAQSAKTFSATWKMPATSTIVTGAVTAAVNANKKSVPLLLGTLGTITVAPIAPAVSILPSSFPGSAQLSAWFGPLFSKIEAFRIKEGVYYTQLRDTSKAAANISTVPTTTQTTTTPSTTVSDNTSTTPASDALSSMFSSPSGYFNYFYASALAPVFSNQIIFYIVLLLFVLLFLRFIVNLLF